MADLLELAAKVERAGGPNRTLDYAIHECLYGEWLQRNAYIREQGDDGWYSATPPVKGANSLAAPQAYTASLDAAVTLVPEGWGKEFGDQPCSWAKLERLSPSFERVIGANRHNLALAICAAALLARARTPSAVLQHGGGA